MRRRRRWRWRRSAPRPGRRRTARIVGLISGARAEVEGLHPVRPGAAAGERHLRLGRGAAAVATDLWGLGAEALLQVPAPQLVLAAEALERLAPTRRSLMQ